MASQLTNGPAVAIQVYQALFGKAPSYALYNSYVAQVTTTSPSAFAADLASGFANTTSAALALQVLTNLGVTATTVTQTGSYAALLSAVEQVFTAYGPASRGQIILNLTNILANLEGDATYGVAATAFNAQALADFTYATNTANTVPGVVTPADPAVGLTFTLTAGVDAFVGGAGNETFNAISTLVSGTQTASLSALDAIDGGAGVNTLNVVDATTALIIPTSATVKNIQTANIQAAGTLEGSVAGWTGLTKLVATEFGGNVTKSGPGALTAAATTDVTLTDLAAAASTISVQGGNNVAVTANGVTAAGTINVGTVAPVTGTLAVTANMLATQAGANTADAINTKGGTTVNVTANLSEKGGFGNDVTGGAIGVTGTAATTTVTVTQTAAAVAANEVLALTGAVANGGATAAPGVTGVTVVTGATPATAKAAVAGVVDGAVTISDSTTTAVGTIKTVSLANYGASSSVTSNALTDLSLTGSAGTLTLTRVAALASDTLNLTLTGLSAPTTVGAITTVATGGNNTINDANAEIKTLNVTTGATASKLTAFTDANLTTLNVAGASTLTLDTVNASLTKIAVSGAAGFNGDVSGLKAALTSFTTTSSGTITATLDSTTQTFVGSTGQDVITIVADAKKAITGGSGTADVLVLNAAASTFNADVKVLTKTNVTGFEVLGLNGGSSGSYDLSTLSTGLSSIKLLGAVGGPTTLTKVTAGSALAIEATQTNAITYQVADANGPADTLGLTLGTAANKAGITVASLTLKDANDVGLGTLNVVSNGSTFNTANTITTLTDNGLSTLAVSGNAGLVITGLNQASTQATGFTINNTSTGVAGVTITTLTDANLGSLTFTGTGSSTVTSLAGLTGKVLTLANTGTGTAALTAINTAGTAGTGEQNIVAFNTGLAPGESATLANRTVTNTSGTATITATNVAIAMSGGTGALTGFTAAVTTTANVTLTSTTLGAGVANAVYTDGARPAAATVAAGTVTSGNPAAEFTTWTMGGLDNGQSYVLDGVTVLAQRTLTGAEVAGAFTGGATVSAGNFTVTGTPAVPSTWTGATFTNAGASLALTDTGGTTDVTNFTTAPTSSAATTASALDATVIESVAATAGVPAAQALQTITLTGNVALGANSTTPEAAIGATTGVTVSGATDNAHVNITLNGAAAAATDSITLGNGNNFITDNSTAGTVNVTVGSGGNLIDVNAGTATTFAANITLGAHTNTATVFDKVMVSVTNGQTAGFSTTITGSSAGDVLVFVTGADITWDAVTAGEQATITGAVNLAGAITAAFGTLGAANSATAFQYGGDTYVIENVGADTVNTAGTDSVVKLVGLHTVGDFGTAAGSVAVVS
jgi:S-layer protein